MVHQNGKSQGHLAILLLEGLKNIIAFLVPIFAHFHSQSVSPLVFNGYSNEYS